MTSMTAPRPRDSPQAEASAGPAGQNLHPGKLMAGGLRDLAAAPFRTLLALALLVQVVFVTVPAGVGDPTGLATIALIGVTLFIDMVTTMAAGVSQPEPSADRWIRATLRRRCFWRYIGTTLIVAIFVGVGAIALFVGAIVVAGIVALAQPAAVLERRSPGSALERSAQLSRPARKPIMIVFSLLILLPQLLPQALVQFNAPGGRTVFEAAGFLSVILSTAGVIALSRAFVALGGVATPSLEELALPPT